MQRTGLDSFWKPPRKERFNLKKIFISLTLFYCIAKYIHICKRMSWQAYVDTQLVATGHVENACMLGAADGSVWGLTGDFQPRYYEADTEDENGNPIKITVNEVEDLLACFQSYFAAAPANGLRVNGTKFMWLGTGEEQDVQFVRAQKGSTGLCMAASQTCIVIATADKNKGQVFTSAVSAVINLTKYLNDNGY